MYGCKGGIIILTPEQYDAFQKAVQEFEDYIQNPPEIIEETVCKWTEQLTDVKDIVLGDKVPFKRKGRVKKNGRRNKFES